MSHAVCLLLVCTNMKELLRTQERQQHEEDLEHNNGVYYSERLQPVPAEAGAGAWATGVKRSADKVCVPASQPTFRVLPAHDSVPQARFSRHAAGKRLESSLRHGQ